jgi:GT2 family glycosyltransferase
MFLRQEDYWKIGGFDEGYFLHVEDLDLCLRFRRAGGEILFAPDVVVRHLGGTSDSPKALVERHKARSFRRYFRQNFASLPKWCIRQVMRPWAGARCRAGGAGDGGADGPSGRDGGGRSSTRSPAR